MRNTILFDLDGTLLPMDNDLFMTYYFDTLSIFFQEDISKEELIKAINTSSVHTVMTNDGRSNEDIFVEHFNSIISTEEELSVDRFYEYYDTHFDKCKEATWVNKEMVEAVAILKEKGYKIVVATNPLLPMRANHKRINWAGFSKEDFSYISSFEGNAYCKPFLEFYNEVLTKTNTKAEEAIMVGNDTLEDLVASHLGIETYLIEDCILDKKEKGMKADHKGSYKDFLEFVKGLANLKKN